MDPGRGAAFTWDEAMSLETLDTPVSISKADQPGNGEQATDLSRSGGCVRFSGRVGLVISNLEYGGAQRQVIELANRINAEGGDAAVCCLSDYVPLAATLHDSSRRLFVVAKRGKFDLGIVPRLARWICDEKIDVVHSFLFDAEMAARLAGRLAGRVAIIGSERNTDYKLRLRHRWPMVLTDGCFDVLIANSHAGKRFQMRELGISASRIHVVPNGVDVNRFSPRPAGSVREKMGITNGFGVVGMFCSFKVQKNHAMFFRMARRVLDRRRDVLFLCVGAALHGGLQESDYYRTRMTAMIDELDLTASVRLLGNRDDIVNLYNACDVTVLTSRREGTPNVLLESMACGVPVIATDVADNALVVPEGRVGHVVPFDDDELMAKRVLELLSDDDRRCAVGAASRDWVSSEYSIDNMVRRTTEVYQGVWRQKVGHG